MENNVILTTEEFKSLIIAEYKYKLLLNAVLNSATTTIDYNNLMLNSINENVTGTLRTIENRKYYERLEELKEQRVEGE